VIASLNNLLLGADNKPTIPFDVPAARQARFSAQALEEFDKCAA
jgi:hypothetical protein